MSSFRSLSKQTMTNPKLKYWLCVVGVIIIMSVLASLPPISKNNIAGSQTTAAAKKINGSGFNFSSGQAYVQTATAAGQGSMSAVQGPSSATNPPLSQAASTLQPTFVPPVYQAHLPCNACGGPHLMCPDVAGSCSGCFGPAQYVCLIEE